MSILKYNNDLKKKKTYTGLSVPFRQTKNRRPKPVICKKIYNIKSYLILSPPTISPTYREMADRT